MLLWISAITWPRCLRQRWNRIRITGVDSGRILGFSFGPGSGVKHLGKAGPGPESLFHFDSSRSLCGHFLSTNMGELRLDLTVAGVWTGVGFSNLKNCRTRIRTQKFWNRSGFGVWKSDSGHLWFTLSPVLPVGRFSRTLGLFFSLRCGMFLLLRVADFWASLIKMQASFLGCFSKKIFYQRV